MKYRTRTIYTTEQKAEMWDRWQKGESLNAIGRVFDWHSASIFGVLSRTGGIRPPERKRLRLALSLQEREEISRGIVCHLSLRTIASQLGRAPSTISREVQRNGGLSQYRANEADKAAWARAHRPKPCKLKMYPPLRRVVVGKLRGHWAPEQIAGRYVPFCREGVTYGLPPTRLPRYSFILLTNVKAFPYLLKCTREQNSSFPHHNKW